MAEIPPFCLTRVLRHHFSAVDQATGRVRAADVGWEALRGEAPKMWNGRMRFVEGVETSAVRLVHG